jgi:hypothetical protein
MDEEIFYDQTDYLGDFQDPREHEFKYCECGKLVSVCADAYSHMSSGY